MPSQHAQPWQESGARSATQARHPWQFIQQHLAPLFFRHTTPLQSPGWNDFFSDRQFWEHEKNLLLGAVRLSSFILTDWFPRAPGVYWSDRAEEARERVRSLQANVDVELGSYYTPESKVSLIEDGGIGTIRLMPRRIDSEDYWLATAVSGSECHAGIPLAIPDPVLRAAQVNWGDRVKIQGQVRSLQHAGLVDTAASIHHARPLIVFVDRIEGIIDRHSTNEIVITPVVLFKPLHSRSKYNAGHAQYTFVQCLAGSETELRDAEAWIEKYADKFSGRVITNFDEQRPTLADAPLSYQRLVAGRHDHTVIEHFAGNLQAHYVEQVLQQSITTKYYGDVHMGHNIHTGGSAIVNIDTKLTNVTQTLGSTPGLDASQKIQLEAMVQQLKDELDRLKITHVEETAAIAEALEKAISNAARPPAERKKSILQLSANGLKEASELVKDIAPNVVTTAGLIAKFVLGL